MAVLSAEQTKFLYLLAYMYMQQSKYAQALHLFRILRLHTAGDSKTALTLAFCLYKANRFEEGLKVLHSIEVDKLSLLHKTAYYFVGSKVLWELKQEDASREMLHHYLKCRKLNT